MFRQVWVNDEDTNLQRIVWRDTPNEPIAYFQLKTVTYGTASAPYLTIKSLHQLAQDEWSRYPTAAEVLIRDCYVDDILSGSTDFASTMSLKADLISLQRAGGFTLKKWATNYETLIDDISPDCRESGSALALESDTTVKTLGVLWYPSTDDFGFKVSLPSCPAVITKRNLLSDASRLFDPLGFLTPSTIIAKTMFQSLWTSGVGWDDPLPPTLAKQWVEFRKDLPLLECIRVPCWLCTNSSHISYELHGFADASSIAYAAVVYARITSEDGNIHLRLLTAKSKSLPTDAMQVKVPQLMSSSNFCPSQLHVDEIMPGIYLTNSSEVWTPEKLRSHGFTHIINIDKHIQDYFKSRNDHNYNRTQNDLSQQFETLDLNFGEKSYLTTVLPNCYKAVKFIDKALQNGGAILVIDRNSNQKCLTIVTAYLMYKNNLNFNDAFQRIKKVFKKAELERYFICQLYEYEPILQVQRAQARGNSCSRELRSAFLKRKKLHDDSPVQIDYNYNYHLNHIHINNNYHDSGDVLME